LVIDTATQAMSLALFEDDMLLARHHAVVGRGHSEALMPAIAALPRGGRADRIAVDAGPGSFTGVRIGIAGARALAFAWGAALTGYGALMLVAVAARRSHDAASDIAVAMTGGHGELFWQRFDPATLRPRADVASAPPAVVADMLSGSQRIYGSAAQAVVAAWGHGTAVPLLPDASDFPWIADDALLPPTPVYGRGPDAKPMAGMESA
jgi:tRNA threonylcarbamoyladenosine biosynthesis protein TsaB